MSLNVPFLAHVAMERNDAVAQFRRRRYLGAAQVGHHDFGAFALENSGQRLGYARPCTGSESNFPIQATRYAVPRLLLTWRSPLPYG